MASDFPVVFALYPDVTQLDFTGPLEVLSRLPHARIVLASTHGGELAAGGLTLGGLHPLAQVNDCALLCVPGGFGCAAAMEDSAYLAGLRRLAGQARYISSVCTGSLLLGAAGLLRGKHAACHWAFRELLDLFGAIPDAARVVRDGNLFTGGGVTAGIDLALTLVEDDLGRDTALGIARELVVFLRRPGNQAQFSAQLAAQVASREPLRDVQRWIAENPAADLSVETLAVRASLSPRQFARAFAAEVGVPPGRYVDRVRLESARRRLEDTADGVEETARACGYGTPEAMRRAFVKALGASPAEYRRRFARS